MISRRDKQMLKQLSGLRENRMRMAEYEVAKAKAAVEEAEREVEQARQERSETKAWSQVAYRKVSDLLTARGGINDKVLAKWKFRRNRIRDKLAKAEEKVVKAKENRKEKEQRLQDSKSRFRDATMAIERLKLLRENME